MSTPAIIAAAGAGRMGRGIAIAFAIAGHEVRLLDLKQRSQPEFDALRSAALGEIAATLVMLEEIGFLDKGESERLMAQITVCGRDSAATALADAGAIFEGVPETLDAKREALGLISRHARPDAVIASTTSTILSNDLAGFVSGPERFLNAHWLNPAYMVPLVELSPADTTDAAVTARLQGLLEAIGKIPVVCAAAPGYIVPRIQMLAMNEAARMVEEGIASADDIDKATRYGFGLRFAVLGMLEFIDWGGGDILFHASNYMAKATGDDRYAAPEIVNRNMRDGRIGMRSGQGFRDYRDIDVPAYQRERLAAFAAMLKHLGVMPKRGPS